MKVHFKILSTVVFDMTATIQRDYNIHYLEFS